MTSTIGNFSGLRALLFITLLGMVSPAQSADAPQPNPPPGGWVGIHAFELDRSPSRQARDGAMPDRGHVHARQLYREAVKSHAITVR